jgi:uncharacterized protein YbbC (DUF1343 family)
MKRFATFIFIILCTIQNISAQILPGANSTEEYLPLLKNKKVALVVNQTSTIGKKHLVDSLLALNVTIVKVFAPEHGFRGTADAGADIKDGIDKKSGLPIISLYGKKEKPSPEDLAGVDYIVFDIQDVGCRFYTFLSTLHYVLEASAENKIPVLLLDRPNPNGFYVDGPVLDMKYKSFVGIAPVPIVHGLTFGEYAQMAKGEKWINKNEALNITIIPCKNYTHKSRYKLPIKPSPNLPNERAVFLYPSLCLFEGTNVSVGRGTPSPFQVIGSPYAKIDSAYKFTPKPQAGALNPFMKNKLCYGYSLIKYKKELQTEMIGFNLNYLKKMYASFPDKSKFFLATNFFEMLAGTDDLRQQLKNNTSIADIKKSWQPKLDEYKKMRKKYLLYTDF